MDAAVGLSVDSLVQDDRVHRRIYIDPEIFELEMERIFERAWIYVCHASQIPAPGDFFTTLMGHQPVICSRHSDGKVYVLHNRCGHRGAIVCNEAMGNTGKRFRCPYHGWTYGTNGDLRGVPVRGGYGEDYDLNSEVFGLVRVPRVATYKGFVFASLDRGAPAFELPDPMLRCIDKIVDRAPEGEIEVTGGVHRYEFRGNWKAQVENILDHYHPAFSHESTTDRQGTQFRRHEGEAEGPQILDREGAFSGWDDAGIFTFEGGHGYQGPMPGAGQPKTGPVYEKYRAAMLAKHAPDRVQEILDGDFFHNAVFYPNMFVQLRALFIRVIRPLAVDHTAVNVYPIKLKGAPDEMFEKQIRFLNMTHSAGSLIQTDDMEMFRRVQGGMHNSGAEWGVLGRGRHAEQPHCGGLHAPGTSELSMRTQYRAWKEYMSAPA